MGKNKTKPYAKPVKHYQGYNIRTLLKDGKNPSGKFGIFAGKKMITEVLSVEDGVKEIDKRSKQK